MRTYELKVHKESDGENQWWVFTIPALDTVGQARHLSEVPQEAKGIIAAWEELADVSGLMVELHVDDAEEARAIWNQAEEEEAKARAAAAHAAAQRRKAVALLRQGKHYSAEDAARVLGVSRSRIYQLERSKATHPKSAHTPESTSAVTLAECS